jgi:hypothetical protein
MSRRVKQMTIVTANEITHTNPYKLILLLTRNDTFQLSHTDSQDEELTGRNVTSTARIELQESWIHDSEEWRTQRIGFWKSHFHENTSDILGFHISKSSHLSTVSARKREAKGKLTS